MKGGYSMNYDFDKIVERRNTSCVKWDAGDKDVLPMWVADMDFEVLPEILEAVKKRAEHGVYGYTLFSDEYYNAVISWVKEKHNWDIKKEWIIYSPGVVTGLNLIVKALNQVGDKVVIQTPVYYPFYRAIENNGFRVLKNPLKFEDGKYKMDFEDLEKKLKDKRVKTLILCSPHNPVGRVWTKDELKRLGDLCLQNGVTIISDEIHSDIIYKENEHTTFASISKEFENNSIVCMSASKTFNLAGLRTSSLIIPNEVLRRKVINVIDSVGNAEPNAFSECATVAAYNYGKQWLSEMIDYLKGNLNFMKEYINENMPYIKVIEPEGTYLAWLDFRALEMEPNELHEFILKKAKVWFDEGYIFGYEGNGFERINLACPRIILKEALERINKAINQSRE